MTIMDNLTYNVRAILKGFSESDIAGMVNEQEARIKNGSVFSKAKVSLTKFRLVEPANRAALYRAFSIAVLRRNNSAEVGVTERLKAIQHLQGMWYRKPICTGRESNKGYICSFGIA